MTSRRRPSSTNRNKTSSFRSIRFSTKTILQRVPQEHERPVETGEPEAESRLELTRQETQPDAQVAEMTPTNVESANQQSTNAMSQRAELPSSPRQQQTMAKLSRQPLRSNLNVSRQTRTPSQPTATSQPTQQQLTASESPSTRRQQEIAIPSPSVEQDQAPQRVSRTDLARATSAAATEQIASSLPMLQRRIRQRPRQIPNTSTPIDVSSGQPQRKAEAPDASSTLMTKRTTAAPETMQQIDLQPTVAPSLDRRSRVEAPATETLSPTLARSSRPTRSRAASEVEAPAINSESAQPREAVASFSTPTRQRTNTPNDRSANAPSDQAETLTSSAQAVTRTQRDVAPSVSSTLATQRSFQRSRQLATRASANTDAASSVEAVSESNTPSPATEPSRMALSRSSVGVAGVGNAANLERGMAAPDSPVRVASAAANRARATQDMQAGPALSPSAPALTRQMRAHQNSPRTAMQAQPIESAMVAGADAPTAVEASSSAAMLERSPSNSERADVTAARGTSEIDLGPTRIAADTSDGRAEGGGQPEVATGELPRALPREDSVAGRAGIKTSATASQTMAPPGADVSPNSAEIATATGTNVSKATAAAAQGSGSGNEGELASAEGTETRVSSSVVRRAETGDSGGSPAMLTGGNRSPGRATRSVQLRTETTSDLPVLAGTEASSGSRNGQPLDAQGARPERSAAGLLVDNDTELGAVAGPDSVEGDEDGLPSPQFSRSGASSNQTGDMLAVTDQTRGAPRRSRQVQVSGTTTEVELDPEEFAVNTPGTNVDDSLDGAAGGMLAAARPAEPSGGGMLVDLAAEEADGGLGDTMAVDVGIVARNSNPESELVSVQPSRFLRRTRPAASVAVKTDVVTPTRAFQRRMTRKGDELAGERGLPSPKTEAAIELGLVFLSRYQSADGSWSLNNFADGKAELPEGEEAVIVSDTAATGLALLSYLGAGYHHRADKYQQRVKNGIDFLVQHQREDGDLYLDQDANSSRSAWLYSHAIATLALCEAYGMTQDPELKPATQKAVNFILESQHEIRGGWRYSPGYGTDTSVTGWMMMAMKSAELAGLSVPPSHYERIAAWLDLAKFSDEQPYLFRYNPYAPDTEQQRHGRRPTRTITSVGLLMRLYTGWKRNNPNMILGARTLAQNLPELGTASRPRRDTYYWYYATQVMFHMGGEYWSAWNEKLHPLLTSSQVKDGDLAGSWNPVTPIPDRWGSFGGRLYVTTMNLLSLEVFYRHLPLYEDTAK